MTKGRQKFLLVFILGSLFLLPNFYRNKWNIVNSTYYEEWQTRYDRLVIARLVKTRQEGFFSAGGLLGLGDVTNWSYETRTNKHQYKTYLENGEFQTYISYRSNPGLQGILYGILDKIPVIPPKQKLQLFRGLTALASAMVFALGAAVAARELGLLAGLLVLLSAFFSDWLILPAGSIFYNLWAFYLPAIFAAYLLTRGVKKGEYPAALIHWGLFGCMLIKIFFSGFELITTALIMATVPFIHFAVLYKCPWKEFLMRMIKVVGVLMAGIVMGLCVLAIQIAVMEHNFLGAMSYLRYTVDRRITGSSENYVSVLADSMNASVFTVIGKYLSANAMTIPLPQATINIAYWQLIAVFLFMTVVLYLRGRLKGNVKNVALVGTTWYSILAPLSWYVIFKPHSYIHTHIYPMAWEMPFVPLGFALCGFVITDLFRWR